jgi:hypothetical protein
MHKKEAPDWTDRRQGTWKTCELAQMGKRSNFERGASSGIWNLLASSVSTPPTLPTVGTRSHATGRDMIAGVVWSVSPK